MISAANWLTNRKRLQEKSHSLDTILRPLSTLPALNTLLQISEFVLHINGFLVSNILKELKKLNSVA
jgi:hypothetical protein